MRARREVMAKDGEFLKRSPAAKTSLTDAREKAAGPSRRAVLKAGGALLGSAAGAGAITGFPTIWAQEIKDIELRHVGVSYSVVKAIGDQASKDLGFKVTMQNLDRKSTRLNSSHVEISYAVFCLKKKKKNKNK